MATVGIRPRVGISQENFNALSTESKEQARQGIQDRILKMTESQGKEDGLAGKPMNKGIIEDTGSGPFSTKLAVSYSKGYVQGRETRGSGRFKKHGKKHARKTRRGKKLNGRK